MKDEEIVQDNIVQEQTQTYTKQAILTSKKFAKRKDLASALLEDNKKYTLKEVESLIKKYLNGVIK